MRRETCQALLIDLDGVLRVFDPGHAASVEQRHGLPAGAIVATAFERSRLAEAVLGRVTHQEWLAGVAEALTQALTPHQDRHRGSGSEAGLRVSPRNGDLEGSGMPDPDPEAVRAAVAEWSAHRGEVRAEVLDLIRELRAGGVPVAIASNATDWLDADLAQLGLTGEVDAVVNSSVLRRCKPTAEFFHAACEAVATPPAQCLFVDDDDRNVRGARAAGLSAYRYTNSADLRYVRAALRSAVV